LYFNQKIEKNFEEGYLEVYSCYLIDFYYSIDWRKSIYFLASATWQQRSNKGMVGMQLFFFVGVRTPILAYICIYYALFLSTELNQRGHVTILRFPWTIHKRLPNWFYINAPGFIVYPNQHITSFFFFMWKLHVFSYIINFKIKLNEVLNILQLIYLIKGLNKFYIHKIMNFILVIVAMFFSPWNIQKLNFWSMYPLFLLNLQWLIYLYEVFLAKQA